MQNALNPLADYLKQNLKVRAISQDIKLVHNKTDVTAMVSCDNDNSQTVRINDNSGVSQGCGFRVVSCQALTCVKKRVWCSE